MRRWLLRLALAAPVVLLVAFAGMLWSASGQLLAPSWHGATRDLAACPAELEKAWGPACGNLRATHALAFEEVRVPALGGYDLPGWLIRSAENGGGPAAGAILLVHGGGSDRRELTRHVRFYLSRHLDVLTFDLACHGEAPCPVPGLTYGERESRDVLSAYLWLTARHGKVLAMGSSVGASALLEALPAMPRLVAVVAENPDGDVPAAHRRVPRRALDAGLDEAAAHRRDHAARPVLRDWRARGGRCGSPARRRRSSSSTRCATAW